jgi:anthranilate/para-aminobenzoate synthase component I
VFLVLLINKLNTTILFPASFTIHLTLWMLFAITNNFNSFVNIFALVGQIEPILKKDLLLGDQPIAIAVKIPTAIVIDHHQQQTYLLDQFDNQQRIDQILSDIAQLQNIQSSPIQGSLISDTLEISRGFTTECF